VFLNDVARRALNAFCLVAIEAGGFDRVFQLRERRLRVIFRRAIFPKQTGRDHVDAFVGGLRRKDGRYEQLKRISKVQLAMRVWINSWPGLQKLRHTLASSHLNIILQGAHKFQSAFGSAARNVRVRIRSASEDGIIAGWARERLSRAVYQMTPS